MQKYDVIILPLAEHDIVRNIDYIFYKKKALETARNLQSGQSENFLAGCHFLMDVICCEL